MGSHPTMGHDMTRGKLHLAFIHPCNAMHYYNSLYPYNLESRWKYPKHGVCSFLFAYMPNILFSIDGNTQNQSTIWPANLLPENIAGYLSHLSPESSDTRSHSLSVLNSLVDSPRLLRILSPSPAMGASLLELPVTLEATAGVDD